jgi:hypothetical protein
MFIKFFNSSLLLFVNQLVTAEELDLLASLF